MAELVATELGKLLERRRIEANGAKQHLFLLLARQKTFARVHRADLVAAFAQRFTDEPGARESDVALRRGPPADDCDLRHS